MSGCEWRLRRSRHFVTLRTSAARLRCDAKRFEVIKTQWAAMSHTSGGPQSSSSIRCGSIGSIGSIGGFGSIGSSGYFGSIDSN